MASLPITSTYAPPASFFRPRRHRQQSFSSSASLASLRLDSHSSEDESSEYDSSDGSESTSASEDDFERATAAAAAALGPPSQQRGFIGAQTVNEKPPLQIATTSSRIELKLSLAITRARHALKRHDYDSLSAALGALKAALPPDLITLGVFVPILERFSRTLKREVEGKDKHFRKSLSKLNAKALIALQQRWCTVSQDANEISAKGVEDHDWALALLKLVKEHAAPPFDELTPASSAVLDGLERLLFPSTLPRLTLSGQALTDDVFGHLAVLRCAPRVLEWYLSFVPSATSSGTDILNSVTALDLSKNSLSYLPAFLPELLPNLETLNLSNNAFQHLPPSIVLFSNLKHVKTRANRLAKHGKTPRLASQDPKYRPTRANIREVVADVKEKLAAAEQTPTSMLPTLFSVALDIARQLDCDMEHVPEELARAVSTSYICCSCQSTINEVTTPMLHLPPIFERVHHLDPGVIVPPQDECQLASISVDERVMLALYGRNTTIETFVIGDPPASMAPWLESKKTRVQLLGDFLFLYDKDHSRYEYELSRFGDKIPRNARQWSDVKQAFLQVDAAGSVSQGHRQDVIRKSWSLEGKTIWLCTGFGFW
ncbi:hypothetical protein OIV83_000304 [Microbotryomycetes sp. JL201]|nr:hypothetical protein OIV83_000304 [Microbotryomycetes sp. JL201]